ncbi:MAG: DUF4147 domain-containing protein, partial [Deltaproteobacteria bacterium]|nr:DUF4147 domain-containing protein [Deltaproteobacteria bacterium]
MKDPRTDIRAIFDAGLKAADPGEAVKRTVRRAGECLEIGDRRYDVATFDRILVVGAGKAAASMAAALEDILIERITGGVIITKYGYGCSLKRIPVLEAAHPIPDEAGVLGSRRILDLLEGAGERDLILCLISGGGSALMPMPIG